MDQIYEDLLEEVLSDYNREFGSDPIGEKIMESRAKDSKFDIKQSEDFKNKLINAVKQWKNKTTSN